jgi:hypothetical protein
MNVICVKCGAKSETNLDPSVFHCRIDGGDIVEDKSK